MSISFDEIYYGDPCQMEPRKKQSEAVGLNWWEKDINAHEVKDHCRAYFPGGHSPMFAVQDHMPQQAALQDQKTQVVALGYMESIQQLHFVKNLLYDLAIANRKIEQLERAANLNQLQAENTEGKQFYGTSGELTP